MCVKPPNCYIDYIDPKYPRDRAPQILPQPDGTEAFVVPGDEAAHRASGFIDGAGFSIKDRKTSAPKRLKFADLVREGAYGGRRAATLHGQGWDRRRGLLRFDRHGFFANHPRCRVQGRLA